MAVETGDSESDILAPDEAFSVLGNETRIDILQTLGEAEGPLSFTELRDSVGIRRGGRFTYHLEKVVGHFVEKNDAGYELLRPGERVVEAVLSGAVTQTPVVEQTQIDQACQLCGAPIEVRVGEESIKTFCTKCGGMWSGSGSMPEGYLGRKLLPPAGVDGRTPTELYEVAWTWTNLELFALASDICPRCAAQLVVGKSVCPDHDGDDGLCATCDNRYAVRVEVGCSNCIFRLNASLPSYLISNTDLMDFLTTHGLNPVSPDSPADVQRVVSDFEEEIRSVEPLDARITFTVEHETLTLMVDDDLCVRETQRELV